VTLEIVHGERAPDIQGEESERNFGEQRRNMKEIGEDALKDDIEDDQKGSTEVEQHSIGRNDCSGTPCFGVQELKSCC